MLKSMGHPDESSCADGRTAPEILTVDPTLLAILAQVRLIAPEGGSVLIVGETGTGKELIARQLHDRSPRVGFPFVARNMGCITPDLANSELFGHRKGSFTGAWEDHPGLLEIAGAGTLFLDEIGECPLEVQRRLLRVVEDKRFQRMGDTLWRSFDARIVAATNVDLDLAVRSGHFRKDLLYRLTDFPIHLPPLRARSLDIELLANHFLREACRERAKGFETIHPEAILCLKGYSFPGNVRELQKLIHRAVVYESGERGKVLLMTQFRADVRPGAERSRPKYMRRAEALKHLRWVMENCPDTKTARAKSGLSPSQFYKLRKFIGSRTAGASIQPGK